MDKKYELTDEILKVDGVITSNYSMSKPMSDGGALAMTLMFGYGGSTNEVNISLSILYSSTKKLIWNYNNKQKGDLGSTPEKLVTKLMRKVSKKMPYIID